MLLLPRSPQSLLRRTVVAEERRAVANKAVGKRLVSALAGMRVPFELRPATEQSQINEHWLPDVDKFVAKAVVSACGRGVTVVERQSDTWKVGERPGLPAHVAATLFQRLGSHVMAEEHIASHPTLRALCPMGELVDLRIMFLHGEFFVGRLRVPTLRSRGYGNVARGAFGVCLNEEGRVIGHHPYTRQRGAVHPDSGRDLDGFEVPAWTQAVKAARQVAQLFGSAHVSVDGTIDAEEQLVVLEVTLIPSTTWLSVAGAQAFARAIRTPCRPIKMSKRGLSPDWRRGKGASPRAVTGPMPEEGRNSARLWLSETPGVFDLIRSCQPYSEPRLTVRPVACSDWWSQR